MGMILLLVIAAAALYLIYKLSTTNRFKADENEFEQAGVRVVFDTGKITINGKTYDVNAVQGIESTKVRFGMTITLKVDDFKQPLHRVNIVGFNNAGDKFIQRLSAALRKAGGSSFY